MEAFICFLCFVSGMFVGAMVAKTDKGACTAGEKDLFDKE
jgi:hypothetical protein